MGKHKIKYGRGFALLSCFLLLVIAVSDSFLLVKGEKRGIIVLEEHLFFETSFVPNIGIVTRLTNAEFHVFMTGAEPGVSHNLTVRFESWPTPIVISDLENELVEMDKGIYSISVQIPGSEGRFWFMPNFFNKTILPPVSLTLLPSNSAAIEYISGGWCSMVFSLNTTILFNDVAIDVRTSDDSSAFYEVKRVSSYEAANRTFHLLFPVKDTFSQGRVVFHGATRDSAQIILVDVFLDGQEVEADKIAYYYLSRRFEALPKIPIPHYDNASSIYLLNFSSISEFTIRLDTGNREQICYLDFESWIEDFDATEVTAFDQSYYQIRVKLQKPGQCYLGLGVLSKNWAREEACEDIFRLRAHGIGSISIMRIRW
jgi:hypothetical protein